MRIERETRWFAAAAAALFFSVVCLVAAMHSDAKAAHRQAAAPGPAGQITGKVFFHGEKPKLLPINMGKDPICASEHSETVYAQDGAVNSNDTLPNAFVYVKQGSINLAEPA